MIKVWNLVPHCDVILKISKWHEPGHILTLLSNISTKSDYAMMIGSKVVVEAGAVVVLVREQNHLSTYVFKCSN